MSNFVFNSPAVKTNEIDLTTTSASLGITTAGLVGETTQGPAFLPTWVTSMTDFTNQFGNPSNEKLGTNLKYLLPYYANSYLSQSNQLYVTRILGLSGYQAGPAWGIKISAALNPATLTTVGSFSGTSTFTGSTFSGATVVAQTGVTFTIAPTYTKVGTTFTGIQVVYEVTNYVSTINGLSGTVAFTSSTLSGKSYSQYEDMIIAIVRTRGLYVNEQLTYNATGMSISLASTTNPLTTFTITSTGTTVESHTASLNPATANYLPKVIGQAPKDKNTTVFVESIYPDLFNVLVSNDYAYGLSPNLVEIDSCSIVNYGVQYQTPMTPWVVSELRGSTITRLFQFVALTDGDAANQLFKVSIQNIAPDTQSFDVLIRSFGDTDANPVILEAYSNCNMIVNDVNFIGRRIGDGNNDFNNQSNYVYVQFNDIDNIPDDVFPAGFEGYDLRSYSTSLTCGTSGATPAMLYKTSYNSLDKVNKTFLGISERAYDTLSSQGTGFNPDMFDYYGDLSATAIYKTNGFHMDSGATGTYYDGTYYIGQFTVGADQFQTALDIANPDNAYYAKNTRKFTLAPYGGFDGWDIYRDSRTNTDLYRPGGIYYNADADWTAYYNGIQTFNNTEETVINLFATPGLDWSNNNSLVDEAITMIEEVRQDSLYVIDAPYLADPDATTYSSDISDLLNSANIDSNYCATYAPWIQQYDQYNTVNVYVPPTGEVLKAMAYTDATSFPWFAPAGFTRGVINANKAQFKLTQTNRDTLYDARINPIVNFSGVGVDIFGQKTLQMANSELNRINVRRLLLYLKRTIVNISNTLLFDQDDQTTINNFINQATPVFNNVKQEQGILNYKIVYQGINTPTSMDQNQLYFNLFIQPIGALEFMGLNFIISPQGVTFS